MGKFIDMTGWIMAEHGVPDSKITVLRRVEDYISPKGYHTTQWECQCNCGNIFISSASRIKSGETKSCGCLQKEIAHLMTFKDLTGQKFGKLTVLYRTDDYIATDGKHRMMWRCICDCGNECDVLGGSLTFGATRSCGCLQRESSSQLDMSLRECDKDGNITKRTCQRCKRMLPIEEFYKNSSTADGYSGVCKYCQQHSMLGRYNIYKKNAKKRSLQFNLIRDEFALLTSQPCYYCGEYSHIYFEEEYSGLDRIDSSKGYIIDNVVPCCEMCNRMKLDYNTSDWLLKMNKILKHLDYHEEQNE